MPDLVQHPLLPFDFAIGRRRSPVKPKKVMSENAPKFLDPDTTDRSLQAEPE
jgi:hypothetical protein